MNKPLKLTPAQNAALDNIVLHSPNGGQGLNSEGAAIQKSATIGYDVNPSTGMTPSSDPSAGTVTALRREALDDRVTMLSYTTDEFVFFMKVPRRRATSTVQQYTVFDRHSRGYDALEVDEGQISAPRDPELNRKVLQMKYLSATCNVTLQATLADAVESPVQVYTDNAIGTIVQGIESQMFYGDSSLSPYPVDANSTGGRQFDGLAKLIPEENVIDAKGNPLSEADVNAAATKIKKAFGKATDMFMPIEAKAPFIASLPYTKFVSINSNRGNTVAAGYNVNAYNSVTGPIELTGSSVMTQNQVLDETQLGDLGQALTPTVTAKVNTNAGGKFRANHEVGQTLNYKVVAYDSGNASFAADASAAITNATDGVALSITAPRLGKVRTSYVAIYRQALEDGQYYLIKKIGTGAAVKGVISFTDTNDKIPGTCDVFIGEMLDRTINLYEWLPIMSLPLAQVSASYTWSVLWFGALCLRIPRHWARIKNVQAVPVTQQY